MGMGMGIPRGWMVFFFFSLLLFFRVVLSTMCRESGKGRRGKRKGGKVAEGRKGGKVAEGWKAWDRMGKESKGKKEF
jgi:hypothetical protein